jgi:hypothetical protein
MLRTLQTLGRLGNERIRPRNPIARGSITLQAVTGIYVPRRRVWTAGERLVGGSNGAFLTPFSSTNPLVRTTFDPKEQFLSSNREYAAEMTTPDQPYPRVHGSDFFFFRGTLWATGVDATNPRKMIAIIHAASAILGVPAEKLADEFAIKNINVNNERELSGDELVKQNIALHSEIFEAATEVSENFGNGTTRIHLTSNARNPKLPRAKVEQLVTEHGGKIVEVIAEKNIISAPNEGDGSWVHNSERLVIEIPR